MAWFKWPVGRRGFKMHPPDFSTGWWIDKREQNNLTRSYLSVLLSAFCAWKATAVWVWCVAGGAVPII